MRQILGSVLKLLPFALGSVFLVGGAYVGWVFYQVAQGDLVEVEIKDVDIDLNIQETLFKAAIGVVINQELDLELQPDIEAEVEFSNPLRVSVTIHEVEGELTVAGQVMDYRIDGLDGDVELEGKESHTISILLEPDTAESLKLAGETSKDGVEVEFRGTARVSVWGQEQTIPVVIEKRAEVFSERRD